MSPPRRTVRSHRVRRETQLLGKRLDRNRPGTVVELLAGEGDGGIRRAYTPDCAFRQLLPSGRRCEDAAVIPSSKCSQPSAVSPSTGVAVLLAGALLMTSPGLIAQVGERQPPPGDGFATERVVLAGTVVGADTGAPIRDGTVSLVAAGTPEPLAATRRSRPVAQQTSLDERGRFEFRGVVPGDYRIEVLPGATLPHYLRGRYPDSATGGPSLLAVDAGRPETTGIVVRLERAAAITGRVLSEDGSPVANAFVSTISVLPGGRSGRPVGIGWPTDDTGSFRVFALPAGEYLLQARPGTEPQTTSGFAPPAASITGAPRYGHLPTYFPGTSVKSEAQPIRITAGEVYGPVDLRMPRVLLLKVSGTVLDSSGTPVPQLHLQLRPESGPSGSSGPGAHQSISTSFDGTFAISGVPPGIYTIAAYRFGGGVREFAWARVALFGDAEGLVLGLRRAATVRGTLSFEGSSAASVRGVQIRTVPGGTAASNAFNIQAESDGTFVLAGLFGPTLVRVDAPSGWYLKNVFYGARDITDEATEFTEDGSELRVVLTEQTGTVTGRVTTSAHQRTDAAVVLFSADERRWDSRLTTTKVAYAGSDGTFRIEGLLPGRYLAVALERDLGDLSNVDKEYFAFLALHATECEVNEAEPRRLSLIVPTSKPQE